MCLRRSFFVLLGPVTSLLAGCATVVPDLPPVPVGRSSEPFSAPSFPATPVRVPAAKTKTSAPAPVPAHVALPAPLLVQTSATTPVPAPKTVEHDEDEVLRAQVFLDRANFSPGTLDGRWGPQTRRALVAWQSSAGLPPTGELDERLQEQLPPLEDAFTTYLVSEDDHGALRPATKGWVERSAMDRLGYSTILEAVAERHHSTERAIRAWNPNAEWPNPPAGTSLRVPQVRPTARVRAAKLEIHLAGKTLTAFDEAGRVIAFFPCSIAQQVEKRLVGELHIVNAAEHPNYTFDPALFAEDPVAAAIGRKLIIPPGPNNPVGVAWLSLDRPGYGIHGTPTPDDIGRTESHGCFRLANWNASKLLSMTSIGTPVFVFE